MATLKEQFQDARFRIEILSTERDKLMALQKQGAEEFDGFRLGQVFREIAALRLAQGRIIQSLPPEDLAELFPSPDVSNPTSEPPSFFRWFFNTINAEVEAAEADKRSGRNKLPLWHGWRFKGLIGFFILVFLLIVGSMIADYPNL
jgi:hypothetical protein